jgi:hypothetical protein
MALLLFSCDVDCVSKSRSDSLKDQLLRVSGNIRVLNASTKPCSLGPAFARRIFRDSKRSDEEVTLVA